MQHRWMFDDTVARLGWSERKVVAATEAFIETNGLTRRYGLVLGQSLAAEDKALEEEPRTMHEAAEIGGWSQECQVDWLIGFLDDHAVLHAFVDELDAQVAAQGEARPDDTGDSLLDEGLDPRG